MKLFFFPFFFVVGVPAVLGPSGSGLFFGFGGDPRVPVFGLNLITFFNFGSADGSEVGKMVGASVAGVPGKGMLATGTLAIGMPG